MPSLKDIRSRIQTTKNTQKITSAMKLVSAAKLRRAQQNILALRPYAQAIMTLIADIASTQKVNHPLLTVKENPKSILVVVVSSDRGLCGAFNTNISKFAEEFYKSKKGSVDTFDFLFVGRKVRDYFKKRGIEPIKYIGNLAHDISYELGASIAQEVKEAFQSGNYDEVHLVYNEFKSAISQKVTSERLLPVDVAAFGSFDSEESQAARFAKDLIFEPSPAEIIDQLLHKHFAVQVYRGLSESVAAEHGARMTAMESATKNSGELINKLTLTYNKLRQAAITKEIIEITSGAEAL